MQYVIPINYHFGTMDYFVKWCDTCNCNVLGTLGESAAHPEFMGMKQRVMVHGMKWDGYPKTHRLYTKAMRISEAMPTLLGKQISDPVEGSLGMWVTPNTLQRQVTTWWYLVHVSPIFSPRICTFSVQGHKEASRLFMNEPWRSCQG